MDDGRPLSIVWHPYVNRKPFLFRLISFLYARRNFAQIPNFCYIPLMPQPRCAVHRGKGPEYRRAVR